MASKLIAAAGMVIGGALIIYSGSHVGGAIVAGGGVGYAWFVITELRQGD